MNLTQEQIDQLKSTISYFSDNLTIDSTDLDFGSNLQPFMKSLRDIINGITEEESETIQSIIFKND